MKDNVIKIATRKSPLALWQAEFVKAAILQHHPDMSVELVGFTTKGDKILDTPLAKVGGKGLFVKELETALLAGDADLAVHSMKDVPMEFPKGLGLAVICEREDPRDAFVSNTVSTLADLPQGAVVGTSSMRRQCQLKANRPDLVIKDLRGNVNTRLKKLDEGEYDAIILASAGLIRLGMSDRIKESISPEVSLPAGGQGAVGIETRIEDEVLKKLLAPLHHPLTAFSVMAERAMNRRLEGGCQVPIACFAIVGETASRDIDTVKAEEEDQPLWLRGLVGSLDGASILRNEVQGIAKDAELLGVQLAEKLLAQGAAEILAEVYDS